MAALDSRARGGRPTPVERFEVGLRVVFLVGLCPTLLGFLLPSCSSGGGGGAPNPPAAAATEAQGRVIDAAGSPIEGAAVQVQDQETLSAADGRFAIPDLSTDAGRLVVTASKDGFEGASSSVEPVPGGVTDVGDIVIPIRPNGTRFVTCFLENFEPPVSLSLFISGSQPTSGEVTIPGLGFVAAFSVVPGATTEIEIIDAAMIDVSDAILDVGISITAGAEINVYGLSQRFQSTDAFTVFPVEALGESHRVLSYVVNNFSEFGIVAAEDETLVTITPTAEATGHLPGEPFDITLDRLQAYQLQSGVGDLTGTLVTATKPIALLGAHQCAAVPLEFCCCDHLVEQLPPTPAWGTRFLTVSLAQRLNGDTFRILAHEDETFVEVTGTEMLTTVLSAGEFSEVVLEGVNQIVASKPVLVAQYAHSQLVDGVLADPFMMVIPPTESFQDEYTFATPTMGIATNFVNIVALDADLNDNLVFIDGVPAARDEFVAIADSGYSGARVRIDVGTHTVRSLNPIGLYVYGYSKFDSYGYPGGPIR